MRHRTVRYALAAYAATMGIAQAAHFKVIASLGTTAQIGVKRGQSLYGTLPYANPPVLFHLTTSGAYTALHSFNAATDGGAQNARLAIDQAGDVFGTSNTGGSNNSGTLWKYSSTGTFTTPFTFGGTVNGTGPLQGPTIGPQNALFGTTSMGAPNNNGVVFKMTQAGTYSIVYNFLSGTDGHCPFSGVAVLGNTIYGTTVGVGYGGNPNGSVWKYTSAGGLKTLYVFNDGTDGEWPDQAPAVDRKGNLYGTTHTQNANGFAGAIWTISATGVFSVLRDLTAATDGDDPNSPLVLDTDGNLYGTTYQGGDGGYGTVFRITPAGQFTVMHSFANGSDGANPTGNLVHGDNGVIFGGTATGQVFRLDP